LNRMRFDQDWMSLAIRLSETISSVDLGMGMGIIKGLFAWK